MTLSIPTVSLDDISRHGNGRIHALIDFSILLEENGAVPFTTYSYKKIKSENKIFLDLVYHYNNPWGLPTKDFWDKSLTARHSYALSMICDQSGAYADNDIHSALMSHNYLPRAIKDTQGEFFEYPVDVITPDEGNTVLSLDSINTFFNVDNGTEHTFLRWIDFQESITNLGLTPYIYQTANLLNNRRKEPWDSETLGSIDDDFGILKLRPYAQSPVLAEILLDVEEKYISIDIKCGYFNKAIYKQESFSTVPNYYYMLQTFRDSYLKAYEYCVNNNITPTGNNIAFLLACGTMNKTNNYNDGIVILTQFIHGELHFSAETLRHLLWAQVALTDVDTYVDLPLELIRTLNDTEELKNV
jgi:hypothetical protein